MENTIGRFVSAVDENEFLKKLCGVLLALCPILQHYKGIVFNAGVVVMISVVPYLAIRILANIKNLKLTALRPVLLMLIFQVFLVINHGTSVKEIGEAGVYIVYLVAVVMGCVDMKYFLRATSCVAFIACAVIMLQYVCFYIFGFHLQMVPVNLLLPSADQWILNAQTGMANINGVMGDIYRPSAFFLEPSHAYLYIFPHLCLYMFNEKGKKESLYPSVFISLGLVLTTSGMGIVAVRILWLMYFGMKDADGSFSLKNMLRWKSFVKMLVFFVISEIVIAYVPFLRDAFFRIFVPERDGGSTAISGRIKKALEFLGANMRAKDMLAGVCDYLHGTGFNIPGSIDVFYRHGFVGLILSFSIFIAGLVNTALPNGVVCLGVLGTSLFSIHTHATVYMMYFILLILSGYDGKKKSFLK